MTNPGPLLIDRGDLPSLVAVALEAKPERLVLYHAQEPEPAGRKRRAAAEEHGAMYGVRRVVVEPIPPLGTGAGAPDGLAQAGLLLGAVAAARRLACSGVIWPHGVGPDPEAVGLAVERASLVSALFEVSGDHRAAGEMTIDLPLVDLTAAQLADLAEDTGAPLHAFWPCEGAGSVPCDTCGSCRKWRSAFAEAGVPWPWVPVGAA
jgi:hypothetical protein